MTVSKRASSASMDIRVQRHSSPFGCAAAASAVSGRNRAHSSTDGARTSKPASSERIKPLAAGRVVRRCAPLVRGVKDELVPALTYDAADTQPELLEARELSPDVLALCSTHSPPCSSVRSEELCPRFPCANPRR